jgi:sugar fermentation stimulation protein A
MRMPQSEPRFDFRPPLRRGRIISRPNRFIMMVEAEGKVIRCHCPTTGRLGGLDPEGLPCLYSTSANPERKTGHTVEAISISKNHDSWIGINQTGANRYFEHFLAVGALSKMATGEVRREVRLGKSRIDFLVGDSYIEVKTPLITLPSAQGVKHLKPSRFDSFDRLIKHMGELSNALKEGKRAIIVLNYLYDAKPFRPPGRNRTNSRILDAAAKAERSGVERWQANFRIDSGGVTLIKYFRSKPYTARTG